MKVTLRRFRVASLVVKWRRMLQSRVHQDSVDTSHSTRCYQSYAMKDFPRASNLYQSLRLCSIAVPILCLFGAATGFLIGENGWTSTSRSCLAATKTILAAPLSPITPLSLNVQESSATLQVVYTTDNDTVEAWLEEHVSSTADGRRIHETMTHCADSAPKLNPKGASLLRRL